MDFSSSPDLNKAIHRNARAAGSPVSLYTPLSIAMALSLSPITLSELPN